MATKRTIPYLQKKKKQSSQIIAITAYDYTFASIIEAISEDDSGCDLVLVGDSLAGLIQGHRVELHTTLEEMIYHSRCVSRGLATPLLVADLPFMSYQVSAKQALISAGRLVKEGYAEAVKLEGGREIGKQIKKIVSAGIPVVGHVGLTPQHFHIMGGYKVQGKNQENARRIKEDAKAVEECGASMIVLEGIPASLAEEITATLSIPTIGIGAGGGCNGQILVLHDLLGLNTRGQVPKFVKQFADLKSICKNAIQDYCNEVRLRQFPQTEHTYSSK
jgi:3-methyl-2-oxobutanoate hydroxymethyltransferase